MVNHTDAPEAEINPGHLQQSAFDGTRMQPYVYKLIHFCMMEETKSEKAQDILESLKFRMISILWDDSQYNYNNAHMLIPWIQEEAEYAIKKLDLPKKEEQNYLIKVERIIGEYLEEP